jgi:hypothetical protein
MIFSSFCKILFLGRTEMMIERRESGSYKPLLCSVLDTVIAENSVSQMYE